MDVLMITMVLTSVSTNRSSSMSMVDAITNGLKQQWPPLGGHLYQNSFFAYT